MIEVMRLAPRFIADYLCLEYREKVRNQLNDSIFRNVIETINFALPSEENIGEAHRQFANKERAQKYTNQNYGIRIYDMSQNSQPKENGEKRDASSNRAAAEDVNQGKGENSKLASEHEVTPIIFEECYVKNDDSRFVQ